MTAETPPLDFNEQDIPPAVVTCPSCGQDVMPLLGRHFLVVPVVPNDAVTAECRDGRPVVLGYPRELRTALVIAAAEDFYCRSRGAVTASGRSFGPSCGPEDVMLHGMEPA